MDASLIKDSNRLKAAINLLNLSLNLYPGRGIVIGRDETGGNLVQVYWIMGRSENSRNRVFCSDENGRLFTEAADSAKMQDPSLVIYTAMAEHKDCYVVSNGSQTDDVVRDAQLFGTDGGSLQRSLRALQYEPDAPNFTPRITGQCVTGGSALSVQLAVLRRSVFGLACDRFHYNYDEVNAGFGFCVTTYMKDGNPLPSWRGDPLIMPLNGSIKDIAVAYMMALNEEHFVSIAVKSIPVNGGQSTIEVINKYTKV